MNGLAITQFRLTIKYTRSLCVIFVFIITTLKYYVSKQITESISTVLDGVAVYRNLVVLNPFYRATLTQQLNPSVCPSVVDQATLLKFIRRQIAPMTMR